jgi:hypothetical protein
LPLKVVALRDYDIELPGAFPTNDELGRQVVDDELWRAVDPRDRVSVAVRRAFVDPLDAVQFDLWCARPNAAKATCDYAAAAVALVVVFRPAWSARLMALHSVPDLAMLHPSKTLKIETTSGEPLFMAQFTDVLQVLRRFLGRRMDATSRSELQQALAIA